MVHGNVWRALIWNLAYMTAIFRGICSCAWPLWWKHMGKLGNIAYAKNVSELIGKHFCFPDDKFCFCNNVASFSRA